MLRKCLYNINDRCGVVILNYNTFDDTVECIKSIVSETKRLSYHIYVIDNSSPDKSGEKLQEYYKDNPLVSVVLSGYNGGFSYGNNIGIKKALEEGCNYIFVLNSDIILLNDALSIMHDAFEKDSRIGAVAPNIVDSEGNYVQCARKPLNLRFYVEEEKLFQILGINGRYIKYDKDKNYEFYGMSQGCCFGLKKEFFEKELLDENIFMYCEEEIIAHRLTQNNKKTFICASARVMHKESKSIKGSNENHKLFYRLYRWPSAIYVLRKYNATSSRICRVLIEIRELIWNFLSIFKSNYLSNKTKFKEECRKIKENL